MSKVRAMNINSKYSNMFQLTSPLVYNMGIIWSKREYKLSPEMLKEVKMETGFSTRQVNRLFSRFQQLDHDNTQYLTKADLHHIKEV